MGGSWAACPVGALGVDCPGCGALRAAHHLTRLDVLGAADHHLLLVVALPVAVAWWAHRALAALAGRPVRRPSGRAWVALGVVAGVVVTGFTVLRNLSGSWLAA